jgi:hypothetical protein
MMRHCGSVVATAEAALISDGIAAAQRTGKEGHQQTLQQPLFFGSPL